jgi:prevent-host-death family protein
MRVGLFEAKTHLSDLVERAKRGERITITKRGVPTAMLVAVEPQAEMSVSEAIDRLLELQKTISLGGLTIKELRDHGRKY